MRSDEATERQSDKGKGRDRVGNLDDDGTSSLRRSVAPSLRDTSFTQSDGSTRTVTHPADFTASTQLEHARLGTITPEIAPRRPA